MGNCSINSVPWKCRAWLPRCFCRLRLEAEARQPPHADWILRLGWKQAAWLAIWSGAGACVSHRTPPQTQTKQKTTLGVWEATWEGPNFSRGQRQVPFWCRHHHLPSELPWATDAISLSLSFHVYKMKPIALQGGYEGHSCDALRRETAGHEGRLLIFFVCTSTLPGVLSPFSCELGVPFPSLQLSRLPPRPPSPRQVDVSGPLE